MSVKIRYISKFIFLAMALSLPVVAVAQGTTSESVRVLACTLADYITAKNTNRDVGDCNISENREAFSFHEDIILTEPLPRITSPIHIEGNGFTLSGDGRFRLFEVFGTYLTIMDLQMVEGFAKVYGSAIRIENGGKLSIYNSSIRDCSGGEHGAIYIEVGTLFVKNTTFKANSAKEGAAIHNFYALMTIVDSKFEGNRAERGGAIFVHVGKGNIKNTVFRRNSASEMGGAIENNYGSLQISDSVFSLNSSFYGGAIFMTGHSSLLSIDDSSLHYNSAVKSGGAIRAMRDKVYISDSLIGGNSAGMSGGGISTLLTEFFLSSSRLQRNKSKAGAALYADRGSVTILDTAIADNVSTESGEQLHFSESEVRYLDIRDG